MTTATVFPARRPGYPGRSCACSPLPGSSHCPSAADRSTTAHKKAVSSTIPDCRKPKRQQVRTGAPDRALTANAGLAAVSELCGRLGVIEALDKAAGPIKQRDRGYGAGELLTGIAAAQLAGEDFLTGLDRQRADAAGLQITPVPGLASTTAAGLAWRITPAQWQAVETGLAVTTSRNAVAAEAAGHGAGRGPGHRVCVRFVGVLDWCWLRA